jgi:hypothetical protein
MSMTELKFEYDDDAKPICATCAVCSAACDSSQRVARRDSICRKFGLGFREFPNER